MIPPLILHFRRPIALLLAGLLLSSFTASAREFNVQPLTDPKGIARGPAIGETGLVAWQAFITDLNTPQVLQNDSPALGNRRSDIFVWHEGNTENVTAKDIRLTGRNERPSVFRDSVIFTSWNSGAGGGYPFELSTPPKDQGMLQLESEYPALFDPPEAAPRSALEAEAQAETEEDAPVENTPPPSDKDSSLQRMQESSFQHQMWRGSGKAGDIYLYTRNGKIDRITPGTRHFNAPVMSEAGIALQVARGWPYGYEMLVWKTGATNLVQITTNYYYVLNPNLHGNELVFQGWDGTDYEIFRYRFDTDQVEQITNNQFDDIQPVVWNSEIAWIAHPTINAEVFLLREGAIRKISEGSEDNSAPAIWEGRLVWQGYDDTDLEIYYFNGRRTIKLTSNTWDDLSPQIHSGVITWMSYVDNADSEIMAFDLGDNLAVQLSDNDWEDAYPKTAAERIVWQTVTPEGSQILMATPPAPRDNSID